MLNKINVATGMFFMYLNVHFRPHFTFTISQKKPNENDSG